MNKIDHVALTARFGYRTVPATSAQDEKDGDEDYLGNYPKDVQVEEAKPGSGGGGGGSNSQAKKGGGDLDEQSDDAHDATSLHSGITTFEAGHGGESNLSNAYQAAMNHCGRRTPRR